MSLSQNYPQIKPTLLLDFANTKALDSRVTFTRASTATYYDGKTVAMAEQNLLLQSQAFEDASWTKSQTAISGTNTIVAPDGTTTAEEVRDGTATAGHNVFQGLTLASGTTYVASVFLKNVDRQYAILAVSGGVSAYASAKFDLTGGTSTANQAAGSGWSVTSVAMTSVGSGWYRCVLVFVSGTSGSCNVRVGLASDGTTFTTNGSGLESYTGTDLKIAVWGAQFEQRSSVTAYTATTTAAITNYIPVLMTAASGVARFDNNPITNESLGLLIEEQRTNLLTYSAALDTWSPTRTTVSANSNVAPDGTLSADRLVEDTTASASHLIVGPSPGTLGAGTYTFSVYAKASGRTQLRIAQTLTTAYSLDFDLTALTTSGAVGGATGTITAVGNGWYRCTMTFTTVASIAQSFVLYLMSGGSTTYTGDGWSGMFLWGAQAEAGAFATSYIPTTTATVTRAADAASMTGTNFSSWYNTGEGTVYTDFVSSGFTANQMIISMSDGTLNNLFQVYFNSSTSIECDAWGNGTVYKTAAQNAAYKYAVGLSLNNLGASINSDAITTDTSVGPAKPFSQLNIGNRNGSLIFNGTIKKIAFYPQRVTNAQLQALTS